MADKCLVSLVWSHFVLTMHRSFEWLETVPVFSLDNHSPDNTTRFTSYLKPLLLPEVKYGERFLPVCEKKLCVWQPSAHWRSPTNKYRLFLSFLTVMSVQRCGLSLPLIMEGPLVGGAMGMTMSRREGLWHHNTLRWLCMTCTLTVTAACWPRHTANCSTALPKPG